MKFSEKGENLLKEIEVLSLQPYDDQKGLKSAPIKNWIKGATIGYGYLISQSEWDKYKNGISKEKADELFEQKIQKYVTAVNEVLRVHVAQNQFDAMVLLCYNIGVAGFKGSTAVKKINVNPNDPNIESSWKAWRNSQGKLNEGLVNRRKAEWDIYSKNVYSRW